MLLSVWSGRCMWTGGVLLLLKVAREIVRSSRLAGAAGVNVFALLVKRPAPAGSLPSLRPTTLIVS